METQAWILRRCLTHVNRICGRIYRPRDPVVRSLCKENGVEWPEPERRSHETEGEDNEDHEEATESEAETEDGELEAEGLPSSVSFLSLQDPWTL